MRVVLVFSALLLNMPTDRFVENARFHVRVEAPVGWAVRQQSAYPNVIAVLKHPDGGQILLTGEPVQAAETIEAFAGRNRAAIEKMRMQVTAFGPGPPDVIRLEATTRDQRMRIRQLYTLHGGTGFVLTLSAPAAKLDGYAKALDATWRNLVYLDEE